MKGLVYRGKGNIAVEEVPKPTIQGPQDSIVKVTTASICGSDLHVVHGLLNVLPGTVIGHEYAGIVDEVGSGVTHFKPGDRVVSMAGCFCGSCPACRAGHVVLCRKGAIYGNGPDMGDLPGVQSDYARTIHSDTTLVKIPDGMTDEQVLFVGDILATAYAGVAGFGPGSRGIEPGSTVAVFGAGPVGLCAVPVARLLGASKVIAVDIEDYRLDMAARLGADHVINPKKADPVASIMELTGGWGADLAVEAAGLPKVVDNCLDVVAIGGTVSVLGIMPSPVEINFMKLLLKNASIRHGLGNFIHTGKLIKLIQTGRMDLTPLITHRFLLADAVKAYDLFEKRRDGVIKIVLTP